MKRKRSRFSSVVLCLSTIVSLICATALFVLYTKPGKRLTSKVIAGYVHQSVQYVKPEQTKPEEIKVNEGAETALPETEQKENTAEDENISEKEIYHILLLGEEALKSGPGKGRTDSMLLATILPKQGRCILTSLLRDSYVEPEGYRPCKLNAVYAAKGVSGLYQILYDKLSIWPDGYLKIGFEDFEHLIDSLGGAEVTITEEEAQYLKTHNYISKEEYRNVSPGTQLFNGNQTLGYCRVRYVANCNGTKYDYGRTERQRMVLKSLFERYQKAGLKKMISVLKESLSCLETDLSEKAIENIIFAVYDNKVDQLIQRQLPAKGTFQTPEELSGVTSPLVIDWTENKRILLESFEE